MKKKLSIIFFIFICSNIFSQTNNSLKNFVKGNIQDKISSVKSANTEEITEISLIALDFCIENKEILSDDRELDALCLVSILSIPQNYVDSLTEDVNLKLAEKFLSVFKNFENENVKIAVLNKISSVKDAKSLFLNELNLFIQKEDFLTYSSNFVKSVIKTLGQIGNSDTFLILFEKYKLEEWKIYQNEITESVVNLSENSENEILSIISKGDVQDFKYIYENIVINDKKSKNFSSHIAENLLSMSIYIVEENFIFDAEFISLQVDILNFLADCKWTRGGKTILSYYKLAKKLFIEKKMTSSDFGSVILSVAKTVPLDAVEIFSEYLLEFNKQKEANLEVQEEIVLALISALETIGDKNAFDSLLSVTYYNYSEVVINKARSALASLKW